MNLKKIQRFKKKMMIFKKDVFDDLKLHLRYFDDFVRSKTSFDASLNVF